MIVIFGYGNAACGDDGLGVAAAELLCDRVMSQQVEIVQAHQLLPEHVIHLAQADQAIFIDARANSGQAGALEVVMLRPRAVAPHGVFTHHQTPESLLALCQDLYERAPRAVLFTVCGQNFSLGQGFSAAVQSSLPRLVDAVLTLLGEPATHSERQR
ncbi:MAG: hydrogenase maturation protease [Anaerolineae bacterium]|nr:hydrogenase maturation protease [Anaerolineae bacterium]MDW8171841.1 hydrogenase maturation protease [Anaerolineae bacterium]